jgi:2-oxoglutarate ferredoxin oxidoreductase subunit delta
MDFWRIPLDAPDLETTVGEVHIIAGRCKGCGYCIEFCPSGVLAEAQEFNEKGYHPPCVKEQGRCKNCNYCETVCPEFAIYVAEGARRHIGAEDLLREGQHRRRRRVREK